MFTGLIEETQKIERIEPIPGGKRIFIRGEKVLSDLKIDDSVAVNGVCLTAVEVAVNGFWVEAVAETLQKSTIGQMAAGTTVNLERALQLSDRLGGHIVQGHVNGMATVVRIEKLGKNYALDIEVPQNLERYFISEGSISIDGISLTIARLSGLRVGINIIPHTWKNTNLFTLKVGDNVNIEVDLIAKYVEKLLNKKEAADSGLSLKKIKDLGF